MDASMKCKKFQMEEGIMPLKSLHDGWSRETFQTTSSVELFLRIMKMKNKFCNSHQYEMQKSRDGGGNNTYKIQTCRVEGGMLNTNKIPCLELFTATMKKKQFSE